MVSKCIRLFVLEVRKADGKPYPPSNIQGLLRGLNRVMQSHKVPFLCWRKGTAAFTSCILHWIVSAVIIRELGSALKSASVVMFEHKKLFWENRRTDC